MAAALAAAGADAAAALRSVGIEPADLADPERRVDLQRAFPFFERACELTGDPHFGLHSAALVPSGSLGAIEYAIKSCATIGDAIEQLARYYAVVDDRAALAIERRPGCYRIHYSPPPQLAPPRAAKEFLFAYMLERGRGFCGQPIRVLAVHFSHPEPPAAEVQHAFFGAPVHYAAAADVLELAPDAAELPLSARDETLSGVLGRVLEQMLQKLESKDLLRDVKRAIAKLLPRGAPSVEQVAAELVTSGRTLQRRLQESGTRFSEVVAGVQRELSLGYLADPALSIGEVAYLVGFADTTSFHRAFRRWTGSTPRGRRS